MKDLNFKALSKAEKELVLAARPKKLRKLDEDELLQLHKRARRARTSTRRFCDDVPLTRSRPTVHTARQRGSTLVSRPRPRRSRMCSPVSVDDWPSSPVAAATSSAIDASQRRTRPTTDRPSTHPPAGITRHRQEASAVGSRHRSRSDASQANAPPSAATRHAGVEPVPRRPPVDG